MNSASHTGFGNVDLDSDMLNMSTADMEQILLEAEALGLSVGQSNSDNFGYASNAPTSHMESFQELDFNALQDQLLALQPQAGPRLGVSQSGSAAGPSSAPCSNSFQQIERVPSLELPSGGNSFLTPPRQTYGQNAGSSAAQSATAVAPGQLGGFWAGKLATAQGVFASVVARILITKDRPNTAIEDFALPRWPPSFNLQISSFHAVNSSDLQQLFARTRSPFLELVPSFADASLPSSADGSITPQTMWELFQTEMMNGRLIAIVPFPHTAASRGNEGLILFAQPNRIFAGSFAGRYAPLPQLTGPSVVLNFQQQQQRLLNPAYSLASSSASRKPARTAADPYPRSNRTVSPQPSTSAPDSISGDPELDLVIRAWTSLTQEGKEMVVAVVQAALGQKGERADGF